MKGRFLSAGTACTTRLADEGLHFMVEVRGYPCEVFGLGVFGVFVGSPQTQDEFGCQDIDQHASRIV